MTSTKTKVAFFVWSIYNVYYMYIFQYDKCFRLDFGVALYQSFVHFI